MHGAIQFAETTNSTVFRMWHCYITSAGRFWHFGPFGIIDSVSIRGSISHMNRWNIPAWLESEVRARDTGCIYCRVVFGSAAGTGARPSWEHIINDARIITRENIALCCRTCNSSKGARLLADWLSSPYCARRGVGRDTVAEIVRAALPKL